MIKYQIKDRKLLIHLLRSNNLLSMQIIKIKNNWKLNKRNNKKLRNKEKKRKIKRKRKRKRKIKIKRKRKRKRKRKIKRKRKRNKNIKILHRWEDKGIKLKE